MVQPPPQFVQKRIFNFFFPWVAGPPSRCHIPQSKAAEKLDEEKNDDLIDYSSLIQQWDIQQRPASSRSSIGHRPATAKKSAVPMDAASQFAELDYLERQFSVLGDLLSEASEAEAGSNRTVAALRKHENSTAILIVPTPNSTDSRSTAPPSEALLHRQKEENEISRGFNLERGDWT